MELSSLAVLISPLKKVLSEQKSYTTFGVIKCWVVTAADSQGEHEVQQASFCVADQSPLSTNLFH